jgi:hypothetical protein
MSNDWQPIETAPEGVAVETKIDDEKGVRNLQDLRRWGSLWWFTDGSMYVYYQPTHWREIPR